MSGSNLGGVSTDASTAATCSLTVASSQTEDSETTFSVVTWNIRNGRNGGIESACRALAQMKANIAVLQETKLTQGIYTRHSSGFSVVASEAPSAHQGGLALCWKESPLYELEEWKFWSPHVLSFRLITGEFKFWVVGCYIPPTSLAELEFVRKACDAQPKGFKPLLIGDFNIDLDSPRDTRDEEIAEEIDFRELECLSAHFLQRRRRHVRGRWTWRQRRLG
jgi:exonuclease III